jgi:hypothetical protein
MTEKVQDPIKGYVRCNALLPVLGAHILSDPEMPTLRVLAVTTHDGPIALRVTAEIAQAIADMLARAASEMASVMKQLS